MKTQINLFAACFLLAGVSMAPRVAHAQLFTPPCTAASLTGGFGYELRGTIGGFLLTNLSFDDARTRMGLLTFDGAGHFTDIFTESVFYSVTRQNQTQGTYTISSDCTTGTLIMHGNNDQEDCVHVAIAFAPTPILLGTLVPGPPVLFLADAALSCTDSDAKVWNSLTQTYTPTYTGILAQL
jgi:hypothetical protein